MCKSWLKKHPQEEHPQQTTPQEQIEPADLWGKFEVRSAAALAAA